MDDACVVLITTPNEDVAAKIAEALVAEHLAACVNILPSITSVYRWEGALQRDSEILLIVKTRQALLQSKLIPRVKALHPYDVPEVIALPITAGAADYLNWLAECTASPAADHS